MLVKSIYIIKSWWLRQVETTQMGVAKYGVIVQAWVGNEESKGVND